MLKRLDVRKHIEMEAAFVITNMAKISLTRKKNSNRDLARQLNQKNAAKLKRHMHTMRGSSR